jgi:two-component system response regulator YesN
MVRKTPEKRPIFRQIFASLVLSIVVIVAILSAMFYVNIEGTMSDQISAANLKGLDQIQDEVHLMTNMASTISYQIYNDVSVSKLLFFSNPIPDEYPAMIQIANYRFMFPIIDSIYVYNGDTDAFYVRSDNYNDIFGLNKEKFYDKQALLIIENHKDFKTTVPIPRRYTDADGNIRGLYTFIMYNDLLSSQSAVVVNIDESFVESIIEDKDGGESFIMDGRGIVVSDSADYPMLTDISGNGFVSRILTGAGGSGYFVADVKGVKSLVVHTAPDSLGWTYVRVFRWDALFRTITNIKLLMIIFSLAILVLGVFTAFMVSRQLYRPIYKLISNLKNLEAEKQDNTFLMKQELLRDMILDSAVMTKQDLIKKHGELNVAIPAEGPICLALVRIDRFKEFVSRNGFEERAALKAAIAGIAAETLSGSEKLEAVDIGDDAVAILLDGANMGAGGAGSSLAEGLAALQAALLERTKLSVSIAASEICSGLESLHELYGQALKASQHRFFFGHGCVVFAEEISALPSTGYQYPVQKEKLLIDALMENKIEEVKRVYREIVDETVSYPFSVFNLTISHLIFTLNSTISVIMTNNSISSGYDGGIPVGLLSEVETMEEFNGNIFAIFDRLSRALDEKRTLRHDTIVNSINDIIQARYASPDLSISSIAEALGMSDAYICRIYKQLTLHTILEMIVHYRMQRARELLKDTDCPITKIAERCGFANSTYFYTAFKSSNGVTPSDYRKNLSNIVV